MSLPTSPALARDRPDNDAAAFGLYRSLPHAVPIALRLPLLLSDGLGESFFREAVVASDAGGEAAVGFGRHAFPPKISQQNPMTAAENVMAGQNNSPGQPTMTAQVTPTKRPKKQPTVPQKTVA